MIKFVLILNTRETLGDARSPLKVSFFVTFSACASTISIIGASTIYAFHAVWITLQALIGGAVIVAWASFNALIV